MLDNGRVLIYIAHTVINLPQRGVSDGVVTVGKDISDRITVSFPYDLSLLKRLSLLKVSDGIRIKNTGFFKILMSL